MDKSIIKNMILFVLPAIIVIIIMLGTYFSYIIHHESAHALINTYHGCTNYTIHISLLSGHVDNAPNCFPNKEMEMQAMDLHSMNEIVGYNVMILSIPLFLILFVLLMKD